MHGPSSVYGAYHETVAVVLGALHQGLCAVPHAYYRNASAPGLSLFLVTLSPELCLAAVSQGHQV